MNEGWIRWCYWLLIPVVVLLPWNPLLSTMLNAFSGVESGLWSAWKELVLFLVILIGGIGTLFVHGKWGLIMRPLSLLIIGYSVLSVLTGLWLTGEGFPENLAQVAWGVKYGIFFLLLLLVVSWIPFSMVQRSSLIRLWMMSMVGVVFLALLQSFVLPEDVLTRVGYLPVYGDTEAHLNAGTLSYCHKIENAITHEEFCRLQGTLSGPNQFGALMLILIGVVYGLLRARAWSFLSLRQWSLVVLMGLGMLLLLLTWSRSALIGLMMAGVVTFVLESQNKRASLLFLFWSLVGLMVIVLPAFFGSWWLNAWQMPGGIAALAIALGLLVWSQSQWWRGSFSPIMSLGSPIVIGLLAWVRVYQGEFFWNIFLRPSSTQGHWERMQDGVSTILAYPLGLGLGDAGPASARFSAPGETGFLPESWYLQVGLESGVMGFVLFLVIILVLLVQLFVSRNSLSQGLGLSLVGLSMAALFLHTWESAVVAYSAVILIGLSLAQRSDEEGAERSV